MENIGVPDTENIGVPDTLLIFAKGIPEYKDSKSKYYYK